MEIRDEFKDTLILLLCGTIKYHTDILFQFINIVNYLETELTKIFSS